MAGIFGSAKAAFEIVGQLVATRVVTSAKQPDWKLYVLKIGTMGSTLEVEVTPTEFERVTMDSAYAIRGKITDQGGRMKLVAQDIKLMSAGVA